MKSSLENVIVHINNEWKLSQGQVQGHIQGQGQCQVQGQKKCINPK